MTVPGDEDAAAALLHDDVRSASELWLQIVRHLDVLASIRRELDEDAGPSPDRLARILEILMATASTTRHRVVRELELDPVAP